jgi:hypothetical protein
VCTCWVRCLLLICPNQAMLYWPPIPPQLHLRTRRARAAAAGHWQPAECVHLLAARQVQGAWAGVLQMGLSAQWGGLEAGAHVPALLAGRQTLNRSPAVSRCMCAAWSKLPLCALAARGAGSSAAWRQQHQRCRGAAAVAAATAAARAQQQCRCYAAGVSKSHQLPPTPARQPQQRRGCHCWVATASSRPRQAQQWAGGPGSARAMPSPAPTAAGAAATVQQQQKKIEGCCTAASTAFSAQSPWSPLWTQWWRQVCV